MRGLLLETNPRLLPSWRFLLLVSLLIPLGSSHGGEYQNAIVAGIAIPVPPGMWKASDEGVELMVPGFRGGQVAYRGSLNASEIVAFYQDLMPRQAWKPFATLITGRGLLVYTKENDTVLLMMKTTAAGTLLAILVGSSGP